MKGKEIAELISTAYEMKNPNNAIALFDLLCDQINFPHFAEYERGYTVGKNGRAIEDDIYKSSGAEAKRNRRVRRIL